MILLNAENFLHFEWEYILYLHKTFANNTNISLLLKGHHIGLTQWQLNTFEDTNCIKYNISDIASLVINLTKEQYYLMYNKHTVSYGLLTIENLNHASLLLYEKYIYEDNIADNHPYINSVYSTCLKYLYG